MANLINWFEIPASDIDRAVKFYSQILGREIHKTEMGGVLYAFLSLEGSGIGGAIGQGQGYEPGPQGVVIYFNAGEDLSPVLDKVEAAGGKVVIPKTLIDEESGYFAQFLDTEGNRIGLHSMK